MPEKKSSVAFILPIIGGILVIVNGLLIAMNGSVITLWSYPVSSVNQLNGTSFWGRVSLGIPAYAESGLIILWLIFAMILLLASMLLFLKPRRNFGLSLLIVFSSLMSIPIGGGFIIGFLMALIGGLAGMEWPKPLGETFVGRFLRALRLDPSLFRTVSEEPKYLRHAAWMLILINFFSGLGYGIYSLNVANINKSVDTKFSILLLGQIELSPSGLYYSILYVGIAFIKWFILSLLVYLVGAKVVGSKADFNNVAAAVAFAYAPVALQIFLPLVFSTQPVQWAMDLFWLTNIWMVFALIVGIKQSLEIPIAKAFGLVLLCGGIYWIITYNAIVPFFDIPGVWFILQPLSFVLILYSIAAVLATLTGVFTRR